MAVEPNFEKVVASIRKKLGVVQSQVECKLPTSEEVNKILCSNAKVNVVNVEISGKDVVYSGFVNFQILYLDNTQNPVSIDYAVEFKDKYTTDMDNLLGVPIVKASVIDVQCGVYNGDLKATATLELSVDYIQNNSHMVLSNVLGENYFVKTESLNYSNYVATTTNKFELLNDVEIKDGVSKVLSVCPSVFIEKVSPADRYLTVSGGVYFDICYLTDNNIIRTAQSNFDFSQEIAHDDLDENSLIQNNLQILYNDIKVTTNIDTDSAIINIELPLLYEGYIFKNNSIDAVSDVYSTEHFNTVVVESVESITYFDSVMFNEKISGSITIQENDAFIDELLGNCCSSVVVANSMINDNRFTVEGVATISVLYLNKETNMVYAVDVEIPFSTTKAVDFNTGENTPVRLSLTDISTRARRGKEIEVTANLEIYSDIYNIEENAVITQLIEEDEIPENECAMSFYLTKDGDTIWEIAKELRISTEMLLAQNPTLSEPIKAGTRVVVYRQRQVEF